MLQSTGVYGTDMNFTDAINEIKGDVDNATHAALLSTVDWTAELVRSKNSEYFSRQEGSFEFHPINRRGYKDGTLQESYYAVPPSHEGKNWCAAVESTNPLALLYEFGGAGAQDPRFYAHKKGEPEAHWRSRSGTHDYPAVGLLRGVATDYGDDITAFFQSRFDSWKFK